MRKFVSLGAALLFLVGIFIASELAAARPNCSCAGCALRPNMICASQEDGGVWMPCSFYIDYCISLSAPATDKVAAEPEFIQFEFLLPAADGRLSPLLPVAKPGC